MHGVLNTDNMNVTGESFDYGPWRFLPTQRPQLHRRLLRPRGLYAFGRQPRGGVLEPAAARRRARPLVADTERAGRGAEQLRRRLPRRPGRGDGAAAGRASRRRRGRPGPGQRRLPTPSPRAGDAAALGAALLRLVRRGRRRRRRALGRPPRRTLPGRPGLAPSARRWTAMRRPIAARGSPTPSSPATEPEEMLIEEVEALWAAIAEATTGRPSTPSSPASTRRERPTIWRGPQSMRPLSSPDRRTTSASGAAAS